ncbi:hypothetical protein OIE66_40500 [Nonomuraea sp. NBC_01738]|uniref:hypothetical protein n=1 Tax=Nonomuraea sp. NBC_01738 TaxID=2976003 RepID=UPI002E10047F|nr:hypothetical protein OIE66_40500 [Nonomuraea sp. NBC_01738]
MRIDLPDGQWADLLEPSDMRSGDLKAYRAAVPADDNPLTVGILDAMKDELLRRVIVAWSLDLPLPKDLPGTPEEAGSLDRVPIPVYKVLEDAIEPHVALINADPDPKSLPESAGTSKASRSSSKTTSST